MESMSTKLPSSNLKMRLSRWQAGGPEGTWDTSEGKSTLVMVSVLEHCMSENQLPIISFVNHSYFIKF